MRGAKRKTTLTSVTTGQFKNGRSNIAATSSRNYEMTKIIKQYCSSTVLVPEQAKRYPPYGKDLNRVLTVQCADYDKYKIVQVKLLKRFLQPEIWHRIQEVIRNDRRPILLLTSLVLLSVLHLLLGQLWDLQACRTASLLDCDRHKWVQSVSHRGSCQFHCTPKWKQSDCIVRRSMEVAEKESLTTCFVLRIGGEHSARQRLVKLEGTLVAWNLLESAWFSR